MGVTLCFVNDFFFDPMDLFEQTIASNGKLLFIYLKEQQNTKWC